MYVSISTWLSSNMRPLSLSRVVPLDHRRQRLFGRDGAPEILPGLGVKQGDGVPSPPRRAGGQAQLGVVVHAPLGEFAREHAPALEEHVAHDLLDGALRTAALLVEQARH